VDGTTLVEVVAFFIGRWQKIFPHPASVRAHAACQERQVPAFNCRFSIVNFQFPKSGSPDILIP
jgi:hypothetical protein